MRDQLLHPSNPRVGPPKMAPNKHPNGQQAKPFTPTMSSTFRATKNPLTPKLAGYTPTRTARKTVETQSSQQQRNGISRASALNLTPSLVSDNVTPKSAFRLARRDGSSAAETETSPALQYPPCTATNYAPQVVSPVDEIPKRNNPTVSIARLARARSVANETQFVASTSRPTSSCGSSANSSMFFHVNDTRSPPSPRDLDTRPGSLQKQNAPTTFLYADGTISDNSHREGPKPATPSEKAPRVSSLRPPDLVFPPQSKQPYTPPPTLTRDSQIIRHDRMPASSHSTPSPIVDARRDQQSLTQHEYPAMSLDSIRRSSHSKSTSMDTSEYGRRHKQDLVAHFGGIPHLASTSHQPSQNVNQHDANSRIVSTGSSISVDTICPSLSDNHSPVKEDLPHNADIDKMNELASNARRERKVLDLEISNSSLLAINRTLERELRKQSAELRRYRRLTRSGCLSMTESISSTLGRPRSSISATDDDRSENSDEDLLSSSDEESTHSHTWTANINHTTEHDLKHRIGDEKRFLLDLTKHRQLLIDSQQMNQSIRRCLGWTDSLIQEAKKALDYHVRVSDIDIGGRVLAPDELEGETEGSRGLLSPTSVVAELYSPPMAKHPTPSDIRLSD